jgi:TonB-linked SusC/RagA family outer membrane protein
MQKFYILLLVINLFISITCKAQINKLNNIYTISLDHVPLGKAKETIEKLAAVTFTDSTSDNAFYVTLHITATLKVILDTIFHPNKLNWANFRDFISLAPMESSRDFITIQGIITDENERPIKGATIFVKGTSTARVSDSTGNFTISEVKVNATLVIIADGYKTQTKKIRDKGFLRIKLLKNISSLAEIQVTLDLSRKQKDSLSFNYPYHKTISSVDISDSNLSRNPDPNLVNRLNEQVSGFIVNKNIAPNANQSSVSIRSRITISGYAEPLIVVDDIVFSGKLRDINPDDIESISVLKDAAATSKWGVLSGNGVILVTTKKSDYLKKLQVYINASLIVGDKQNLFYLPRMSSPELIDFQTRLYKTGAYNNSLSLGYAATSPLVEILYLKDIGLISESTANEKITALTNTDIRNDANKYLMQRSSYQHYNIGLSGGSAMHKYYYSISCDRNIFNLIGDKYSRITGNLNNTFRFGQRRSEIYVGVSFMQGNMKDNGISYTTVHNNYEGLKDRNGNPLPQMQNLSGIYTDTAGGGRLPDWKYRLLDERSLSNNSIKNILLTATTGLNYKIIKGLEADWMFRYEKEYDDGVNKHSVDSYFSRNLINSFTDKGSFVQHLPPGDIIDEYQNSRTAENMNVKVNYSLANKNEVFGVYAGAEIRQIRSEGQINRTYGNNSAGSSGYINYVIPYPLYYSSAPQKIPYINDNADTTEKFYSLFSGAAYTYKDRYAGSLSIRKDESNIFGVETNKKGVPFIAAGFSWDINQEQFFHSRIISFLRLRLSHGYCGNVNKLVSSQPIFSSLGNNTFGSPVSTISNPANPDLRWERIAISNAGIDFSAFTNSISGTFEYYIKNGADLIAPKIVDPTSGMTTVTGNTANMEGRGFDITINSMLKLNKNSTWQTNFLMSHAIDKVINYKIVQPAIGPYCITELLNPLEGKPLYSIYGLKFEGLDHANGDPIGYIDNHPTKDYSAIINSRNLNNLVYYGPANPTWFGTFRNTFTWKHWDFSFTIVWKAGYFFRGSSINYYNVIEGLSAGHPDYSKRWQHPGDEKITHVPSLTLLPNYARDFFYTYSTDLIAPGDHIRLQNIRLSYRILQPDSKKQAQPRLEVFLYGNNLGLLWKANHKGIDPDYINSIPDPRSISAGLKANF